MATLSSIIPPVSLSTVSGTLPVGNGGTGATTLTSGYLVKGSGTSPVTASVVYDDGFGAGIGTATPLVRLHISTGNESLNRIRLQNTGAMGGTFDIVGGLPEINNSGLAFYDVLNAATRFYIKSTGGIESSDLADAVGYKGLPQNSQTSAYTLALSDQGKHISITTGGVVIPANDSVAFPIGATIVVFNNSGSSQTISITTDTLRLAGAATTGSRTLAQYGLATLVKVTSTSWVATGNVT